MNMLKLVPIALLSIGLTACGGESGSDIKVPELDKGDVEAINALASGVNRNHDWKLTSSSEDKADADDIVSAIKFSTTKPFNTDRVDGALADETNKIFTYEWQTFQLNDDKSFTLGDKTHKIEVGIAGLATAQDNLENLIKRDDLTADEKIQKAVYSNFALPMALGASELGPYRSFDSLTSEPVVANNNKPLCYYQVQDQNPRTDYSMTCLIPAQLSPFGKSTMVSLEQQPGGPVYYKTSNGDTYQAYRFLQGIDVNNPDADDVTLAADVLIHPGVGIISVEPTIIEGVGNMGIKTTQTKWEWFNTNPNFLYQDN